MTFVYSLELLQQQVIRGYALQGGLQPHSPAVARGRRATSPVRAETLFRLAFSGIAASPPSADEQPKEGPSGVLRTAIEVDAVPVLQVLHEVRQVRRRNPPVLAPGLLGAPSESVQVRGVVSPHTWTAGGHLATVRKSLDVPSGVEMSNERLRSALLAQGMTVQDLADAIEVNPKTVERWITQGRSRTGATSTRRHRCSRSM